MRHKDDHIFLTDLLNDSITELKESGELVCKLILIDEKRETFTQKEIFFLSSEILRVNCRGRGKEKLFFCGGKRKIFSFFKIKKYSQKVENFDPFYVCHHHHHNALTARFSLTPSNPKSLSSIVPGRSSRLYPISVQSYCM